MKIIISDDHPLFADGFKSLLEANGHEVIGIAGNGIDAFDLTKNLKPDVIFLDIYMPKCNGLEATILISNSFPKVNIIILTASESEKDIFNAIKFGACGYLIKSFKSDTMLQILSTLEKGEKPILPDIISKVLDEFDNNGDSENHTETLTKRQREVLLLVAKGYYYKDVGLKLGISERTVKYHIESSIYKLHLNNKQQLINYVLKSELLE